MFDIASIDHLSGYGQRPADKVRDLNRRLSTRGLLLRYVNHICIFNVVSMGICTF